MTPERQELLDAIRAMSAAEARLQAAIDGILTPTPTGHLRADQSWIPTWCTVELDGSCKISLAPPENAYEFRHATADRLAMVKHELGADILYASVIDNRLRYIARWRP